LHSVNRKHAAKRFSINRKTGEIKNRSYGSETFFAVEVVELTAFADLAAALSRLTKDPHAFVIRGEPLPGINRKHCRRLLYRNKSDEPTFKAVPRRWFAVDIDHVDCPVAIDPVSAPEDAIEYLIGLLPPELADACCWWQFTSSQSIPGHTDMLSARLWYWLEEAVDDAALKRWATAVNRAGLKIVDPALYNGAQAHYTGAPLFDGLQDPLPTRSGVRLGLEDSVSLITPPADAKNPEMPGREGYDPSAGVAAYLAQIGGPQGSRRPIKSAIASYLAIYGSAAPAEPIKAAIRRALDRIPPERQIPEKQILYANDEHLDKIIAWVRQQHGDQPPKRFVGDPPPHLDEAPPAGDDQPAPPARPVVRVVPGELPAVVDAAEALLVERDRQLYEFGDQVVRPALAPIRIADNKHTVGLRLVLVRLHHMRERFDRAIEFRKFNKKEQQWVPTDCPEAVAATYLERVGLWRLPKLTALASCPLLLHDGRIVDRPGFDAPSGILFDPQRVQFPPVPAKPAQDDARLALADIKALFREFPFVDDRAQSVLLSALLTRVSRLAYDFAPLHGFDAPVAGTGKSKLVDCCAILVNGHECPVISQGDDNTEFEKRLGAELLEGARMISVDNCEYPLGGPLLCQTATQHLIKVRVLGFSKSVLITNSAMLFATGNNLRLYGDMLRRGLICKLDSGEERPELRSFEREDPVRVLKRERGRYAIAALTVLQAYLVAERPVSRQPLGGFEGWSQLVRNALLWLGEEDPVQTIETARAEDPERQRLEAVITQWHAVLEDRSVTTRRVIEEACAATTQKGTVPGDPDRLLFIHPDFRNALLDVAGESGRVSARRLGTWLGANKRKVVGDHRLAAAPMHHGNGQWRLEQRDAAGRWR
jgi:hypothetical protein